MPLWIEREKYPEGTAEPKELQCSDCEKTLPVKSFKPINTFDANGVKLRSRGKVCKSCREVVSQQDPKTREVDKVKGEISGEISGLIGELGDILEKVSSLKRYMESLNDRLK